MAHDVFVSHSVKDKLVADAIVARLEAESVRCWVAPRDVVPGADWGESIVDAIESSRIMILIFSKNANESRQIKREVERAVDKGVYIIPFRVDDIEPPKSLDYFISTAQWMDVSAAVGTASRNFGENGQGHLDGSSPIPLNLSLASWLVSFCATAATEQLGRWMAIATTAAVGLGAWYVVVAGRRQPRQRNYGDDPLRDCLVSQQPFQTREEDALTAAGAGRADKEALQAQLAETQERLRKAEADAERQRVEISPIEWAGPLIQAPAIF